MIAEKNIEEKVMIKSKRKDKREGKEMKQRNVRKDEKETKQNGTSA